MELNKVMKVLEKHTQPNNEHMCLRGPFDMYPLTISIITNEDSYVVNMVDYYYRTAFATFSIRDEIHQIQPIRQANAKDLLKYVYLKREETTTEEFYNSAVNVAFDLKEIQYNAIKKLIKANKLSGEVEQKLTDKAESYYWFLYEIISYMVKYGKEKKTPFFAVAKKSNVSVHENKLCIDHAYCMEKKKEVTDLEISEDSILGLALHENKYALYNAELANLLYSIH